MVTAIQITSSEEGGAEGGAVYATIITPSSEAGPSDSTNAPTHEKSEKSQLPHPFNKSAQQHSGGEEEPAADEGGSDSHSSHDDSNNNDNNHCQQRKNAFPFGREEHKHLLRYQPNKQKLLTHPTARKRARKNNDGTDEGLGDGHGNNDNNGSCDEEGKKVDATTMVRKRNGLVLIDLSDVPPIPPILKTKGHANRGASKYAGVSYNKDRNNWSTQIKIEDRQQYIGAYDNEEEAAIDYARAVLKYKGKEALEQERNLTRRVVVIDLSDVPPQPPIPKSAGNIKYGASKYTGVTFHKARGKWNAKIKINGKRSFIGYYDNEEEAAIDYARALYKYRGQCVLDKTREKRALETVDVVKAKRERSQSVGSSSSDNVPASQQQPPPIPKIASGQIEEGAALLVSLSMKRRKVEGGAT